MAISRQDRAKQFLAFDALNGLRAALREKEMQYESKKELSEEMQEELSNKIDRIKEADLVECTYYETRQYKRIKGIVTKKDISRKLIEIDKSRIIYFEDILEIIKL